MANSSERNKIDSEVVRILRKMGCDPNTTLPSNIGGAPQLDPEEKKETQLVNTFAFLGVGFTLLNWWYFVTTPEPSFIASSTLLLMAVVCFMFAAFCYFRPQNAGRALIILLAIVALVVGSWWWRKQDSIRIEHIRATQRAETKQALKADMDYVAGDNPVRSEFWYTNGGLNSITVTDICAKTESFYLANDNYVGGTGQPSLLCMYGKGESHEVESGGDGQTDPFLDRLLGGMKLACADITVTIKYSLDDQPKIPESKRFRFVTRWYPTGAKWLREDVGSSKQFCQDRLFQAPYGNMFSQ